jgi:hypothetical protein
MCACLVSCSVSGRLSLRCSNIWGALSTVIGAAQRCAVPAQLKDLALVTPPPESVGYHILLGIALNTKSSLTRRATACFTQATIRPCLTAKHKWTERSALVAGQFSWKPAEQIQVRKTLGTREQQHCLLQGSNRQARRTRYSPPRYSSCS